MHASEDPASTQQPGKSPRWRRTGTLLALLVVSFLYASVAASAQSVTFTPGPTQEFKVPLGVATVEVVAVGGEGQAGTSCRNEPGSNGGAGGSGALVTATIPVTGVKTLYVAFGTGGAAGTGGGAGSCSLAGGAGGGSAEVLAGSSTPLVVAGGGGATMGEAEPFEEETNNGGAGANATASLADGGNGLLKNRFFTREEGLGGEGGGAGSGGAAGLTQSSIEAWATPAGAGARASGGNGATYDNAPSAPFVAAGGGGGAGFYGAGGGGAGNLNGGGGGAGSSYVDEATGATGIVASGSGHPQAVTLTYTVAAPPKAVIDTPLAGGTYTLGAVVKTEFSCKEGAGGPGIEACVDSGGTPAGSGTLDTSTVGTHTYTVTAKSKDGLAATTTIEYTVSAPAAQVANAPTPRMCTSARHLTIHLARHLALRAGTRILRANVLLAGHQEARLRGPNPIAHVSLVGLPKRAYTVTFFARTSTGSLLTGSAIYHTCVGRRTS